MIFCLPSMFPPFRDISGACSERTAPRSSGQMEVQCACTFVRGGELGAALSSIPCRITVSVGIGGWLPGAVEGDGRRKDLQIRQCTIVPCDDDIQPASKSMRWLSHVLGQPELVSNGLKVCGTRRSEILSGRFRSPVTMI